MIAHGAAGVTTLEYNSLQYVHPLIKTVAVDEMLNDESFIHAFDVALSISSFEHDGLGRYGDPLNPNGDMIAMRSTRRLLKKGKLNALSLYRVHMSKAVGPGMLYSFSAAFELD